MSAAPAFAVPNANQQVCASIADDGIAVVDQFLPAAVIEALAADARQREAAGDFHPAGVGRGAQRVVHHDIRGDRIAWLDADDAASALGSANAALQALRGALNATLFLGLFSFEGHYAIYPPGASYRRHRDRFRDDDARMLSCVLYLNAGWTAAHSGALRIFADGGVRDVLPAAGTFVCFASERFDHEVLPATRARLSLTGWFKRRGAGPE